MKPIVYSAWLTSDVIPEELEVNDSSTIVLQWLGEEPNDKSIQEIINEEIRNFDWDKHAENIQY